MHEPDSGERRSTVPRRRSSILTRLLAAFVVVSFLPIAVLAILSLQEAAADPGAHPTGEATPHVEGAEGGEGSESGAGEPATGEPSAAEPATEAGHGTLFGVPIEFVELGVAGASLVLSLGAALYVGRTIIRPIRSLEASMHRVETGDLEATAEVSADDEIGHLAGAFNRMTAGLRREAMVRDLFGQYVSPEVARMAIERHGELVGEVVECTVLFVDIRRFTALAEVLPPARLIGTLNRYFERMLVEVEAEGGIVNKFGGDSLLAVFGSPLNPMADHAQRAVRAALRMRETLVAFNREQVASELPELRVGFGLATGELVAGNVGSRRKLEYTVIGDPVNLAARLQELTTSLGAEILLSARTAELARDVVQMRSLGEIAVRGRAEHVEVFAVEDESAPPSGEAGRPAAVDSAGG
jgi:adenylate cyclase